MTLRRKVIALQSQKPTRNPSNASMTRFLSAWGHPGSAPANLAPMFVSRHANSARRALNALLIIHCDTRATVGTLSPSVLVPVMTTTEAVVPARSLTLSGTFSMRTMTGRR
jgi:hypothetical protein